LELQGEIVAAFFFKNEKGNAVTVNGERYRAMLNDFFISKNLRICHRLLSSTDFEIRITSRKFRS